MTCGTERDINPVLNNARLSCVFQHIFMCSLDFHSPSRISSPQDNESFRLRFPFYRNLETPKLDAVMIFCMLKSWDFKVCFPFETWLFLTEHCLAFLQLGHMNRLLVYILPCIWFSTNVLRFIPVVDKHSRYRSKTRRLKERQNKMHLFAAFICICFVSLPMALFTWIKSLRCYWRSDSDLNSFTKFTIF